MLARRPVDAATRLAHESLANAERFYWQQWGAAVEIRHEQYQLAFKQLRQAERLADAGLVPRRDRSLRSRSFKSSRSDHRC